MLSHLKFEVTEFFYIYHIINICDIYRSSLDIFDYFSLKIENSILKINLKNTIFSFFLKLKLNIFHCY